MRFSLNKTLFLWLLVAVSSMVLPAHAETIKLKSGKTVEAKIIEKTSTSIKADVNGIPITYYFEEIDSIDGQFVFEKPAALAGKAPTKIFEEVADSVVVITAMIQRSEGVDASQGSGFIAKKEGVVVTNFHVVELADKIEVRLKGGKTYLVTGIIHFDPKRDVCILKIDADSLPAVSLGNSAILKPGDKVFTIGAPLGLDYSISEGLMSGIRRVNDQKVLQLSAPISPGSSGGPLINTQGEVVGINSSGYTAAAGAQSLNFAIPINEVKRHIGVEPKIDMTYFDEIIMSARATHITAMLALAENNVNEAIRLLQVIINKAPDYIWAYVDLSYIYGARNMLDEGIALCKKAISVDPDYAMLYHNLAAVYLRKGMITEAMKTSKRAVALDPENSFFHMGLCTVYSNAEMFAEAIAEGKKAVELDPYDSLAHTKLGIAYSLNNMHQEAIASLQKAIAFDPNNGEAYFRLAAEYAFKNDSATAAKYMVKAIELGYDVPLELRQSLSQYLGEYR